MEDNLEVLPLHRHPIYIDDCCSVLNAEWPRSSTARIHDLSKSCDELPCSLVLIKRPLDAGFKDEVIGHSKLGLVAGQPKYCCIKSVVIKNEYRKRGLGKYLMLESEKYALCLGFERSYLTTHDQQGFYMKLGYKECLPMSFLSSGKTSINSQLVEKIEQTKSISKNIKTDSPKLKNNVEKRRAKGPAPPPPPLPMSKQSPTNIALAITWMEKQLLQTA